MITASIQNKLMIDITQGVSRNKNDWHMKCVSFWDVAYTWINNEFAHL